MQTRTQTIDSASAMRERLHLLEIERAAAALVGLDADAAFMADLLQELQATRSAYVGAAVTEIASLRAALNGPLAG